jgi:hypothetical protein
MNETNLTYIDVCLKKVFEDSTLSRIAPSHSAVNSAFQSAQISLKLPACNSWYR